jgi:L-alanine-DL-glutamate epimerase-like enolase superfamily enzyme
MGTRRDFLKATSIAALYPAVRFDEAMQRSFIVNRQQHPTIKGFSVFKARGNFYRFVGMNAYDKAPKGIDGIRPLVKVTLSDGTYGIGPVGYRAPDDGVLSQLRPLLGKDPNSFYIWEGERITGVVPAMKQFFHDARFAWFESAVLDAVAKLRNVPVWKLTGTAVRDRIDPYDGTLYFEDIANNRGVEILGELAARSKADGYRGIKIKLGRPSKWLPGEAGVQRDIDACLAVREAVGSNFTLMADANNGYADQMDWSIRLLKESAPSKLYFIEELFPDNAANYRTLRDALMKDDVFVPVAEGESINDMSLFDPYLTAGIYSFLQPDMHTCGYSNILAFARKLEAHPRIGVIPHVWQSQLGLLMSLHAARIQPNIPFVEDSRYFEHAIVPSRYLFQQGQWFIPDTPGWGVDLVPDYKQHIVDAEIEIKS